MTERAIIVAHSRIEICKEYRRVRAFQFHSSENFKRVATCRRSCHTGSAIGRVSVRLRHGASLNCAQLPLTISLGKDFDDLVLAGNFATVIEPRRRITRSQQCCAPEHTHAKRFAADVFYLQIARSHVADELSFVIAFERIGEDEIVSHDAVEGLGVGTENFYARSRARVNAGLVLAVGDMLADLSGRAWCQPDFCSIFSSRAIAARTCSTAFGLRRKSSTPARQASASQLLPESMMIGVRRR